MEQSREPPDIAAVPADATKTFAGQPVVPATATITYRRSGAGSTDRNDGEVTSNLPSIPGYIIEESIGQGGYGEVSPVFGCVKLSRSNT